MHYELGTLERLLDDTLPATSADDLRKSLLAETDRVRLALLEVICSQEPEDIVRRNIRMHQQSLLQLAEQMAEVPVPIPPGQSAGIQSKGGIQQSPQHSSAVPLYIVKLECLAQLFQVLEALLADYGDPGAEMPWFQRAAIRENILSKQAALVKKLNKSSADKQLIGLMLLYKANFLEEASTFTYQQWYQVRELIAAVEKLPEPPVRGAAKTPKVKATDNITEQLIDHLFRLQIHNESLFSFIQEKTREDLKKIKPPSDRLSYLEGTLAHATNIVHFRHPHLAPEPGSLLAQYIEWIGKLIGNARQEIETSMTAAPKEMLLDEKIITSLSKPELALMVRLFIETGVFQNKIMTNVARFMTTLVSTRHVRPGKKESMDNFYQLLYKVPVPTYIAVSLILDKMK